MSDKTTSRDIEKAAIVAKTARITGVSKRSVKRVIAGDQRNDQVLNTYMLFQEGNEELLRKAAEINRSIRKYAEA